MGASLLHDWDFLQERVIPPLLEVPSRPASVWSIGNPADAVAVAVAFAHAKQSAAGKRNKARKAQLCAFASGGSSSRPVSFALADLGCVPVEGRSTWFRRQDRRWFPESTIADHVVLGEPNQPVDLVTIRRSTCDDRHSGSLEQALDRLRDGGRVLLVDPGANGGALGFDDHGLRVDDDHGRLFRKHAGRPAGDAPAGAAPGGAATTLASRQEQDELVTSHVGLAHSLARRFAHRGESVEDLEAVALLALVKAAHRFEPERGTPFAPYAAASVLGELKRHFRDRTWAMRVPRPLQELYLAAKEAREELGQELGVSPTVAQVAEHLGVTEEAVLEAMEAGSTYRADSLDVHGPDDERTNDIGAPDPAFDRVLDRERLRRLVPMLDHSERVILTRLFFDGWTQQQVADEIGVSQMQVSRMLARIVRRMRR